MYRPASSSFPDLTPRADEIAPAPEVPDGCSVRDLRVLPAGGLRWVMDTMHRLELTTSPAGMFFECVDGCSRRLTVDRDGTLTVIDRGDPWALHRGGTPDIGLDPPTVAPG